MVDSPMPLSSQRVLPAFPTLSLPPVLATQVEAVATFTQTDQAMAGTMGLAVLAACAGGRCELEVRPGWREPMTLFLATIAEPGERKSAVHRTMVTPLLEAERQMVEESRGDILEAIVTKSIAEAAAQAARMMAGRADPDNPNDDSAANAISAALQAEAVVVPAVPRIVADDVTPEAAGSLMAEQKGRLAILSAEGGVFDILAGRYSGNVNLDVFLKGHAGDVLKVDRKGRPPEYIDKPALTVGVMIQPAVLVAIAKNGAFRGRGLLARFLFCQPPSNVGFRLVDAPVVPQGVLGEYDATVTALATTLAGWEDPAVLQLEPAALEALLAFAREIEPQLRVGAPLGHVRDWAAKLVGTTARIAGLLHLGADPNGSWRREVTVETVLEAITLARYFTAHALAAFDAMQADPVTADAEYLLQVIVNIGEDTISKRDLFSASSRSRFPKVSDLDPVIARLVEHGYLEELPAPERTGRGRPPSPRWAVHPQATVAQIAESAERKGA